MVVWVQKKGKMASNNSKYTPEYRKEICQLIISSGRSATSIAEEMGIDKNTVCSWMRDYRKQNQLPTYAEEKGIQRSVREEDAELKRKNKEKELEIQRLKKENARLREERDILKKWFFIIFCGFKKRFWELKGI